MKIGFIGFGNIAKAIATGLTKNSQHQLYASSPSLAIGKNSYDVHTHHDNLSVAASADIIILAVKPMQVATVMAELSPILTENCLLISVISGVSLAWFDKQTDNDFAIVRAMPNIAVQLGTGAIPLFANQHTSEAQRVIVEELFSPLGLITWAQHEHEIDIYTALSGSGPAYLFKFMEAMAAAANTLGLEPEIVQAFTLQTCLGACSLAQQNNGDVVKLRQQITSVAGTTAAALEVFAKHHLDDIVLSAMQAAYERSKELGQLFTASP
ncbi:MAG: pyrroline-5-carboxylate reductase [Legionella sp.]